MCEKCANPEIQHHPEHKDLKPMQKKLNTSVLKGKVKKVNTSLK